METILMFAFYKKVYKPRWDIVREGTETEIVGFTRNRSLYVCCIREWTIHL